MSGIPIPKHEGSVEVGPNPPPAGQARPRRGLNFPDHLVTQPIPGIETVYDILLYAARTHGNKRAIGYRDIEKIIEEETEVKKVVGGKEVKEKKTWKYFQLSPFKYLSYIEFKDKVHLVSKALIKHGVARGQVFNVYATTSPNWQLVAHACMAIGNPIATAYDTLGEEGLTHSLSQPDCVGVFTNADLLPTLFKVLEKTPTIRLVVYDGEAKAEVVDKIKGARDGAIEVVHIDAFIKTGQEATDITIEDRAPKSDETSCIMYTSGTTGTPKGVVLTHANLIASVGAVHHLVGPYLRSSDTFLAFLPLAHILEYIVELLMLFFGITNGYGKIRTLTDTNVRNSLGDLRAFQPSIMVGVPAVWETIRKGILGKVAQASSIRQSIFNIAFTMKKNNVPGLKQVADSVVFSQIKDQTGGKLRLALSGGAALSKETQEFLNLALVTLVGGYGMTESCGMTAILPPGLMSYGPVGVPVPSIEIKFLDVSELGYLATNNPPQGEVLIRGPSVTKGYYKRDDLNSDETIFTKDGWFRTGDVGQWNKDGTLSLIDRVKNIVKLQGGEYIALERLESIYKSSNLVQNICVHVYSEDSKQPMALIHPHEANLRLALKDSDILPAGMDPSTAELKDLCHQPGVADLVLKETNAVGKKAGFKPLETLETVVLTPEEWTPESGLVTAAQKLQRKKVAERYKAEIEAAHKK